LPGDLHVTVIYYLLLLYWVSYSIVYLGKSHKLLRDPNY